MAPRPLLPLIIAVIAVCVLAESASAAVFERDGTTLLYTAAPGDTVDLTTRGAANANIQRQISVIAAQGSTVPTATSPCFASGSARTCNHLFNGVAATRLRFETGDGDDKIDSSGTALPSDSSLPTEFLTGAGEDTITGSLDFDSVFAGAGDDEITGGADADVLRGEDGADVFLGLVGDDSVIGGPGADLLDLSAVATGGQAISLNGINDDGPLGVQANVDVENVRGTPAADILTGGTGANTLEGGAGNDLINVIDGGIDEVDCGPGSDRVLADPQDTTAGCEVVELPVDPSAPPPPVDADGDGVIAGVDCDDASAARRQGARDIPGNRIDEDCSGADARRVAVPARVSFLWAAFRDGTEARTLRVRSVPAGGRVQLRCSARRPCGFTRRNIRVKRDGTAGLLRFLRGRRLPAGLVVEVRVSAPEHLTKVARFAMRTGKVPRQTSLCLAPGKQQKRKCR